jgi:hypothetical protein
MVVEDALFEVYEVDPGRERTNASPDWEDLGKYIMI